jgi:hypothetical protein
LLRERRRQGNQRRFRQRRVEIELFRFPAAATAFRAVIPATATATALGVVASAATTAFRAAAAIILFHFVVLSAHLLDSRLRSYSFFPSFAVAQISATRARRSSAFPYYIRKSQECKQEI